MPYLDPRIESNNFVDSLKNNGIDTILLYHKKQGYTKEYFVLWLDNSELQLRNISSRAIVEIADWNKIEVYRFKKIFDYYIQHKNTIDNDQLYEENFIIEGADTIKIFVSNHTFVDIDITIGKESKKYELVFALYKNVDNTAFQFAQLIDSTINIEQSTRWKVAEKKFKYYPKNYDPTKKKWQDWKLEKIRNGEIRED